VPQCNQQTAYHDVTYNLSFRLIMSAHCTSTLCLTTEKEEGLGPIASFGHLSSQLSRCASDYEYHICNHTEGPHSDVSTQTQRRTGCHFMFVPAFIAIELKRRYMPYQIPVENVCSPHAASESTGSRFNFVSAHIATAFVKKIDDLLASDQVCLLTPRGLKRAVEGCDSAVRPNEGRPDTADATGAKLASPPTK
jgi:hypothetical protein